MLLVVHWQQKILKLLDLLSFAKVTWEVHSAHFWPSAAKKSKAENPTGETPDSQPKKSGQQ